MIITNQRAAGADYRFGGQALGNLENIGAWPQAMKLGVTTEEMRGLIAAITDAVGAALWTTGRLPFLDAIVTFAAGSRGSPGDTIARFQGLARPVAFQSVSELFDPPDGFMAENDGQ